MMYAYDAVWSIAYVLKNSMSKIPLDNVTYGDLSATKVFYKEALALHFESPKLVSKALVFLIGKCSRPLKLPYPPP
jgi:hypothetical protein